MLKGSTDFGSLFVQSLLYSIGQTRFENGRLPSIELTSTSFSGICRKNEDDVTVKVGLTDWYLRYEAVKEAAARLHAPTLFMAKAINLAGISPRVNRQGRIFYDASVINGFHYNDKRLFARVEHKDLAIYSEYVGLDFTPWGFE